MLAADRGAATAAGVGRECEPRELRCLSSDFSYETLYAVVDSRWAPARVRTAAQGERSRAPATGDEHAAATQMGSNTVGGCPS